MENCKDHSNCMERIRATEERSKSNTHRIDRCEENQEILMEMNKNIGILAEQYKTQSEKLTRLEKDVNDLKHVPVKRWESIVTTIITVFVSGLAGVLLAQIIK